MAGKSALGAGGALGTAAEFLDGDMHGAAIAVIVVPASGIVTADGCLGGRRHIVGADIAVGFVVAIAAANRIGRTCVVDAHPIETASTALVVATVALGTVKITHDNSPPLTICPLSGRNMRGRYSLRRYQIFTAATEIYHIWGLC